MANTTIPRHTLFASSIFAITPGQQRMIDRQDANDRARLEAADAKADELSASLQGVAVDGMTSVAARGFDSINLGAALTGIALNSINVGAVLDPDITPADAALVDVIATNVGLAAALERMTTERDKALVEAQFNNITVVDQVEVIRRLKEDITRQRWTIAQRDVDLVETKAQLGLLREAFKRDSELIAEGGRS